MFLWEVSIITLTLWKLSSFRPVQQKIKLTLPDGKLHDIASTSFPDKLITIDSFKFLLPQSHAKACNLYNLSVSSLLFFEKH